MSGEKSLHHFNIIEGELQGALQAISDICNRALNYSISGSNHFNLHEHDSFLIEHTRNFRTLQNRKIPTGDWAVSVIACQSINGESQNALLKILEEPTPRHIYFLVVPNKNILLPTVLSRADILQIDAVETFDEIYEELISQKPADRMKTIEKLMNEIKKEKASRSEAKKILVALQRKLQESIESGDMIAAKKLKSIQKISKYADNKGASLKSILEFAVLIL